MPSPSAEQPGLVIRDPFGYAETTLVIPPPLLPLLRLFDGKHRFGDLTQALAPRLPAARAAETAEEMTAALSGAGFLADESYASLRRRAHEAFAAAPERRAAHAGSGYPADAAELTATLDGYLTEGRRALLGAPRESLRGDGGAPPVAIAAPHVSPFGGAETYGAAYHALPPALSQRTFVVLGTSHHGAPDRFGLTRKPFVTPLGRTRTDPALLDALERGAPDAITREDYCQRLEHSIEFQVIFLQRLFGADVRVVPILCGAFAAGPLRGRPPDDEPGVAAFFDALGNAAAGRGDLFFVLGVDMAHVGRRYGDAARLHAHRGPTLQVADRDRARIARIREGDGAGFWSLLGEQADDDLRWCGAAPIYTYLRAVPGTRGYLLRYDQWNIDDDSVVSFAALRFFARR